MGQQVGRMPETWAELVEEKNRVLRWSSEVLGRVDDNITDEDTFLMDYDNTRISTKVDQWITSNIKSLSEMFSKIPNLSEECQSFINNSIRQVKDDMETRMRKDYQSAYGDLKKFTKKVDTLGAEQRKIHNELQLIEMKIIDDVKKFQKQLAPLRLKVFDNLRAGEKMLFEDNKLKTEFEKKIKEIDYKNLMECNKRFEKLRKDAEKYI